MNTNFKVIGLTRFGIKFKFTAPEANALTARPSELLIFHIIEYGKLGLHSNAIDTVYQYEHAASVVISQCVHIVLMLTMEPLAVLNIRNENHNYVIINKVL